jgi:hypothetical protein
MVDCVCSTDRLSAAGKMKICCRFGSRNTFPQRYTLQANLYVDYTMLHVKVICTYHYAVKLTTSRIKGKATGNRCQAEFNPTIFAVAYSTACKCINKGQCPGPGLNELLQKYQNINITLRYRRTGEASKYKYMHVQAHKRQGQRNG